MKVVLLPQARVDMLQAQDFYREKLPGLENRFLADLQESLTLLSRSPDIGRSLGGKSRRLNLSAFPYFLAYSHRRGCLVVTAVLHQARDPQDVKRRLE
ncbi:MAG: hypothetical protein RL095_168 [Verrucomicrobiota bacterium]|jgi:plasmid stabilization system protein ParE